MTSRAIRLPLAAVAAALSLAAFAAPAGSDPLSANWQADARPLFNFGRGLMPNSTRWLVPDNLKRGEYVLVNRVQPKDGPVRGELIENVRFNVNSATRRDLYVMVPNGYTDVYALPVSDAPDPRIDPR